MKQIPNIFTLLNLICGCIAIVYTLQNGITIQYSGDNAQFVDVSEQMGMASLFIGIAAVVDFLDGFVARLFNATSEMGKQLDSLADVVSFGVAPSLIIYQFLRMSFAAEENGINISLVWLIPAFIIAGAAAYRLARFNLDRTQTIGFKGVPVPAVGLLIGSIPLIYEQSNNETIINILLNKWFLYAIIFAVSSLMVSTLPLMAFKFKNLSLKSNLPRYLVILFAIIGALFMGWLAVPITFIAYIILSLVFKSRTV